MILIVGSEGAQGKRYQMILKHLGKQYQRRDVALADESPSGLKFGKLEGVILTTPTHLHLAQLPDLLTLKVPVLVEKPIHKNVSELKATLSGLSNANLISMVYQYRHLAKSKDALPSYYNYFKHGNDGLVWDCLQIIGLAKGCVHLDETSPVWQCQINGQELNIRDMDYAYVQEVKDWLEGNKKMSISEIIDIHEKVEHYAREFA